VKAIRVQSPTLFDNVVEVPLDSLQTPSELVGIYNITIPNVHPTNTSGQEVLVEVVSSQPVSYQPPNGSAAYPASSELAAYALTEIPILE
jgi:hypothetical protein